MKEVTNRGQDLGLGPNIRDLGLDQHQDVQGLDPDQAVHSQTGLVHILEGADQNLDQGLILQHREI